ncbi:putative TetR family transcriptional regulator [Gordonia effusa NBRC 100432]|uniref:Putative TetR family transcriptional regulator n=1 Tax=Gordonia effusa NBRC 100432 TaxID=1077974 RepID=H0R5M0_9ACTN|nr:TetR/AcrR family transcriptional regulator [Gordonia effusa]GAB20371.1 putative TetR family transcriptional regulator [Gordonia effusa NBRC 100432]
MARRKVLTRAESQAITRETLVDAAESLLLLNGYHATSIAAIANEAGRTIGAVYSNYSSKEELCLEVLRRRTSDEITHALVALAAADDDVDARFEAVSLWWRQLSRDTPLLLLAAEYGLTVLRDPDQRMKTVELVNNTLASVRVLVEDHLPPEAARANIATLDRAARAITATGTGLAVMRVMGTVGEDDSANILIDTMKMWMHRVVDVTRQAV